jgi:SAM-dependent methyltransferase
MYVQTNRAYWDGLADSYASRARNQWAAEPSWGNWSVPQSQVPMFPENVGGLDVIELGCGTGYVSGWLAKLGARPVGLDNSPRQLATARAMQAEFGLRFPLVHADAEQAPFADASFDFVVSEYGASIWCDSYRWIPEAARLLRPNGRLAFLRNSTTSMLCVPDVGVADEQLLRPLFGMHRLSWSDGSTEFHLPHGELIRLLRDCGFTLADMIEIQAPADATTSDDDEYLTAEWAQRWPSEEVWIATRSG